MRLFGSRLLLWECARTFNVPKLLWIEATTLVNLEVKAVQQNTPAESPEPWDRGHRIW